MERLERGGLRLDVVAPQHAPRRQRLTSYKLQAKTYNLHVTSYRSKATSYELGTRRVASALASVTSPGEAESMLSLKSVSRCWYTRSVAKLRLSSWGSSV